MSSSVLVVLVCLFALAGILEAAAVIEVEDQREFNYEEGSAKGSSNWGNIKQEWATCKTGKMQSPIDLFNISSSSSMPRSGEIEWFYKPGNATLKNRGHDILFEWKGNNGSKLRINGTDYILRQSHYHSPAEHIISGKRFDLEQHLVHESSDPNSMNPIAVIGVLYSLGKPDQFLSMISDRIIAMKYRNKLEEVRAGILNPTESIIGGNSNYFRYMGSLTTPPCTESVIWTVDAKIRTVSKEQINMLREAVNDNEDQNARPVQPLNGRTVRLFRGRLSSS